LPLTISNSQVFSLCHSGAREARARNPYARWWLWIPGPLALLASRNDDQPPVIGPCFGQATGAPVFFCPGQNPRERSAERRTNNYATHEARVVARARCVRRRHPVKDAAPVGAPPRRFWASGPYFRARMGRSLDYEPLRPTCLGGFRRPSPHRVQPLKAAPRSWSGRLPLPPGA
jgi:hypothetical protein